LAALRHAVGKRSDPIQPEINMSTEVTLVGMVEWEGDTGTVVEIGGYTAHGELWRLKADEIISPVLDYHVYEGQRPVRVECREHRAHGYRYFIAPGSGEDTDLLGRLAPLP
jgi:hypothetical protein